MYMTQDSARPRPLAVAPQTELAGLRWVLTDIDDTLTSDGRLPAAAYAALEALDDAGIAVVPVTGRPAGWCDAIARHWPVAGVVGENGALWYALDRGARRMLRWQAQPEAERRLRRARLEALAEAAMAAVPGSAIAADQPFRLFDMAIDFCEDAGPLGLDAAEAIARVFRAGGAEAKVSSIHVNAWIGAWDKRAGIEALFAARFGDFAALAALALTPRELPTVGLDHLHAPLVSIREQATHVVAILLSGETISFRQLIAGAEQKGVVVARFLAVLELYQRGAIFFHQLEPLGELTMRWSAEPWFEENLANLGADYDN